MMDKPSHMTKNQGLPILDKLDPDEPVFVLRGSDILAAEVVRDWAERARAAKVEPAKIVDALNIADAMDKWQTKKIPD